jgi:hypothetical protein
MIVISSAIVLADAADGLSLDHPVIGWHNVVQADSIVASVAPEANYPKTNLANPATHLEWRSTTAVEQYLVFDTNEVDQIDYLAVARHNFFSAEITVSVEGFIAGNWVEIVEEFMPPDDGPLLCRFAAQSLSSLRLRMQAGSAAPRAAVVYVGKLLVVERKVYVGHTPMPHARKSSIINGRSESGNFLGRIVLGSWRESTVPLSLISPAWYRTYMDPFLAVAKDTPFFFGWRPQSYPRESGFGWLTDDPMPTPTGPSNLIAFDLKVGGVV